MDEKTTTSQGSDSTPHNDNSEGKKSSSISSLFILLIPVAFFVGLGIGYLAWGEDLARYKQAADYAEQASATAQAEQQAAAAQPAEQPQQPQDVVRYDVPENDNPSIGPQDAPITLIEFSDYQCPYCQRWHDEVFTRLLEDYPDQVRIVFRDFPLTSIHPEAAPAAEAANCANEQGVFWEFHNKLFGGEYALGQQAYSQYAADLGMDTQSFEECVSSGRYSDEVQADFQFAAKMGVQSTPTFFLNGIPLVGAQPYEVFQQVIEMELAGQIP